MTYPLEGIPLSEHEPVLRTAEELGYTDAWTAEVNANDAFTPLAAFATWAKNTRLGCAIANIYTRTPTLLAQTASALAMLSIVTGFDLRNAATNIERYSGIRPTGEGISGR